MSNPIPSVDGEGVFLTGDGLRIEFEVLTADGGDVTSLAMEQARVFQEVMAWLTGPTRSGTGQDRAA
jgi:hypothetical protein